MLDLSRLLQDLPVGLWVGRVPDGVGVFANGKFDEILGTGLAPLATIADAPQAYGLLDRQGRPYPADQLPFSRVLASGAPVVIEDIVIRRPDATCVNIRAHGFPVRDTLGRFREIAVAFLDTTEEVRYREELDSVGARLALAINYAPIVVWTADMEGTVTVSEGAGLKPLGVVSGQLVGQNLFGLYRDHPTIPAHIRRALAGESFSYETVIGEAVYETWLAPMRNSVGTQTGIAGISHDVSESRRLQARALQDDRIQAMGTLAASVAHEINNPLTFILGHAGQGEALLARLGSAPPGAGSIAADLAQLREHLEVIRRGAERMAQITRELRTFSGTQEGEVHPVSCAGVVRSVLRLVGKQVEARARLTQDLRDTPPVAVAESRLTQAVLNLVLNALQAVESLPEDRRRVELRTFTDGGQVVIEVADAGPGVPPEARERIFEAFFTTKAIGRGTGLGLFVSRNVVRAAGGTLAVDDRPGGGARFRISLPALAGVAAGAPGEPGPGGGERGRGRGERILVIDDDPLVAHVLAAELTHAGYDTAILGSGSEALSALAAGGFDLAFCDLMMAGMTGMELAARLEQSAPAALARVVFMSGGAFTQQAQAFVDARAGACVDKPFDVVAEAARRLRAAR